MFVRIYFYIFEIALNTGYATLNAIGSEKDFIKQVLIITPLLL